MTQRRPIDLDAALDAFEEDARTRFELGVATAAGDGAASLAFGAQDARQSASVGGGLDGRARADASGGSDDAAAYGLLVQHVARGEGGRQVSGSARADGASKAEGRGLSIGLQEFLDPDEADDDGEELGPGPEDALPRLAGSLSSGPGADRFTGRSAVRADAGSEELIFVASNGVIVDRDGVLRAGAGADSITATGRLDARGGPVGDNEADGPSAGDADLEVIADGLENVGLIHLGSGADRIRADARATSDSGATAIADGIDNSSVGNPNPVGDGDGGVRLLTGRGDDRIDATGRSDARGDGAIANGMDTRSLVDLGSGADRMTLAATADFADTADAVGEQEEAIADGLENRGTVALGSGDDLLTARASATGNGVLTIADGLDSRGDPGIAPAGGGRGVSIDAGSGDDVIEATGRARASAPLPGPENAGQKDAKTIASGLLTENAVAGVVTMGAGEDVLTLSGRADGLGTDTAAFGLSNVSFDIPEPEVRARLDLGPGADRLEAQGRASGRGDVAAYGVWGGETLAGAEDDEIRADAVARAGGAAEARGLNLDDDFDLFGGTGSVGAPIVSDEGALLDLGAGDDELSGSARARGAEAFAAGVFLGEGGVLLGGAGDDRISGQGRADGAGDAFGIAGEAAGLLDAGDGDDLVDASRGGFGGGLTVDLGAGDDLAHGFGDVRLEGGAGDDTLDVGTSLRRFAADGGTAEEAEDGALALISGEDIMTLSSVETVLFGRRGVAADDLVSALAPSLRLTAREDGAALEGGAGDDTLIALGVSARLEGGDGSDGFEVRFRGDGDVIRIADYDPDEDRLIFRQDSADLVGRGAAGGVPDGQIERVEELIAVTRLLDADDDPDTAASTSGGDLVLSLGDGDRLILEGLAPLA